jgi:hypothetical protein
MKTSTQSKLVDENTDLNIPSGYDPLLRNKFEEYIHITERTNPGHQAGFRLLLSETGLSSARA